MNFYRAKINGVPYDKIPQTHNDVSLRRFLAFRNIVSGDPIQLINWGLDESPNFEEKRDTPKELASLFALLDPVADGIYSFMESKGKNTDPGEITVMDVTLKLKNGFLDELPYWPYVITKRIIGEEMEKKPFDPTDRYPEIIAHYLYTAITGMPYDEAKADTFKEVILDCPYTTCIQLGNFFLRKQGVFGSWSKRLSRAIRTRISSKRGSRCSPDTGM